MHMETILGGHLDLNTISEEDGRRYFNLKVTFSDNDVLTIYRNSIEELIDDLPQILVSAIRARIIQERAVS